MDALMHYDCQGANRMVPWFLISSYAYYILDAPVLTDGKFDTMVGWLKRDWESVEHRHKELIDHGWLKAGTCLLAEEAYPRMAAACAESFGRFLSTGKI